MFCATMQYNKCDRLALAKSSISAYGWQNRKRVSPKMKPLFNADEFAKSIRVRIAERDIDMLTAAKETGVSHASISRICSGKLAPGVENYLRIQRWLAKPIRERA
jgi:hypothetical protein